MTKNPRDHRDWTNEELQEDSAGYLAAQQTYREEAEAEVIRRREADDKARFTEEFVAEGGDRADASSVWREIRSERAAEAARRAEEDAGEYVRRHVSRSL